MLWVEYGRSSMAIWVKTACWVKIFQGPVVHTDISSLQLLFIEFWIKILLHIHNFNYTFIVTGFQF